MQIVDRYNNAEKIDITPFILEMYKNKPTFDRYNQGDARQFLKDIFEIMKIYDIEQFISLDGNIFKKYIFVLLDPYQSIIDKNLVIDKKNKFIGAVIHQGLQICGHYTAVLLRDSKFILFDDEKVISDNVEPNFNKCVVALYCN
jgi:uncharacterized UBP type Zn finger protein